MPTEPVVETLVARARNGDPDAWRELHDRIGGRLLVWLRAQGTRDDASLDHDDLSNETWCTAATRIADFSGDDDAFAGWLFGIARNHLINANRRSIRRRTRPSSLDPHAHLHVVPTSREDGYTDAEQFAWIRSVLARLPQHDAEVVACLDVVGLDVASTAGALGLTVNAVRVRHHRAVRRLRTILAAETTTSAVTGTATFPSSGVGIAKSHTVVAPEGLGVHQSPGHPRLVRRLGHYLERGVGDP